MAFIRWKKNSFGIRQAYLVHSYRDETGKPKHKTLAYLGREGALSPEQMAALKEKHADLGIDWEKLEAVPHPAPKTDIAGMTDEELLRRLKELRIERGISARAMVERLNAAGAPAVPDWGNIPLHWSSYAGLEKGWGQGKSEPYYVRPGQLLARFLRQALASLLLLLACSQVRAETLQHLTLESKDRILILSPHPDDDILGCAGVIQEAVNRHLPVAVVYLTNGDNYEWAFMAYEKRPMLLPSEMLAMGRLRRQEAVSAENLLGVPESQLFFLGYPDWGTEHIFEAHWGKNRPAFRSMLTKVRAVPYDTAYHPGAPYKGESVLADLEKIIADFRPTKIFVSHPADVHRDHRTYYLFAQVALWDLEDRLHPVLYPYLIHYPHWPFPRGYRKGRVLAPPANFPELQWTEQELSDSQGEKKRLALEQHHTQMAKDRKYLDSFVAENELFSRFPDLVPGHRAVETMKPPEPADEESSFPTVLSSATEAHWRYIYLEGRDIVFRMEVTTRSLLIHPVILYAYGYRHGTPFSDMPKMKLIIRGGRVEVFDQDQPIRDSAIWVDRMGRTLVLHIPLRELGNPDRVIGTAWSRSAEEPFDWRVWRVIDLRNGAGS
jgi:LmbE family N-acetylglucosaminyl deacetylase